MFDIVFTFATIVLALGFLAFSRIPAELIMMASLAFLFLTGIISTKDALAGFSNEGMMTVAILYIVVAGLQETGAIGLLGASLLGRPKKVMQAQTRLMVLVAGLSAFLNNTPIVAMMIPAVSDWSKKHNISASKLMIPLSYAAILGGTCTLIGTSTNLVVNGLLLSETDLKPLGMFDIAWVGIPCALIGITFVVFTSRCLLPNREASLSRFDDLRQYYTEMVVEAQGSLVGKTVEKAGLRHLPDAFLAEIERKEQILAAVSPQEVLQAGDILRFVGVVDSMVELRKIRGLQAANDQMSKLNAPSSQRSLIEVVVSETSPVIGKSIREARFRNMYQSVIIAVSRNGQQLKQKIGDIILRAGDTLLLEALPSFVEQQKNSRDFYLVSLIQGSTPLRHERAPHALIILLLMIALVTVNLLSMFQAALLAVGAMLLSGVLKPHQLLRYIEWPVLIVIAASFGVGKALEATGGAQFLATFLLGFANNNPWLVLLIIYAMTSLFTEFITNNAAAVLIFPIAYAAAEAMGVNFMPFAIAIMMAASASFATPIGYQTNLMVMGPGSYRFSDYLRIGVPLNILMGLVTVLIIPLVWRFSAL